MENSIYLGLSKQNVLRTNLDIVANNVANMNTPGYRSQHMLFEEYLSDPRGNKQDKLSFVIERGQYEMTRPGAVQVTNNPLDVSLEGPGFLGVQGLNGETQYTRAGNFRLGASGELLTAEGYRVAGNGGGAITIPPGSREVNIDDNGNISTEAGQVGQLMIHEFANLQALKPVGDKLYSAGGEAGAASTTTRVKQFQLESSNVQPVVEMTNMIEVLREFQTMQNVLQSENERLRTAIQRLGRQS